MADKSIEIKIKSAVDSAEAAKSLGQLRKALLDIDKLQNELGESSGPQFEKLRDAAAKTSKQLADTRDRIGDIQDTTRTLEGTPIERLSGSFGLLRESILNLDLDKAKIAVKGLGDTLSTLGKSLLTNPIFLLAAAIALIVAGVVLLLSKLGLLQPILDSLQKALTFVIGAFEELTDWLGLTTNALDDQAEAAKNNGEVQRKEIEKTIKAQGELLASTEGLTEKQIQLIEKKLGIEIDTTKTIGELEIEKQKAIKATYDKEIIILNEKIKSGVRLSDEQKLRLKELITLTNDANQTILNAQVKNEADKIKNETKGIKERSEANKKADEVRKAKEEKRISDELKAINDLYNYKLSISKNELENYNINIQKQKAISDFYNSYTAKQLGISENARLEIVNTANKAVIKLDEEVKTSRESVVKSILDSQDKVIAGLEATLEESRRRELENNDDLVFRRKRSIIEEAELINKFRQQDIELLDKNYKIKRSQSEADFEKTKEDLIKIGASKEELDQLENLRKSNLYTIDRQRTLDLVKLNEDADRKIQMSNSTTLAGRLQNQAEWVQRSNEIIISQTESELADLEIRNQMGLESVESFEMKKAEIENRYLQNKRAILREQVNFGAQVAANEIQLIGNTANNILEIQKGFFDKGDKQREATAKKQFEVNKAVQLSVATITGITTVMEAYSNGMKNPIPLLGPVTGALYAITAGIGVAANLARIKQTKFSQSSFNPNLPVTISPTSGASGAPTIPGAPTFFGLGQTQPQTTEQMNQKVYVTEGDISKVQKKVSVIEERSIIK